ncbi:MAG: hypothetical protein M1813_009812 [Trichoglossum hirsutum]|nr:MAG: hypothetical protein M1813_009812 [Trichoglossum hirsutum]
MDLSGNTFWEFKDHLNGNRLRRIVKYKNPTYHSEVKIPPQWHQWLRQVRKMPPSIAEQQQDAARLQNIKVLARLVDERWANEPSFLKETSDYPKPTTAPKVPRANAKSTKAENEQGMKAIAGSRAEAIRGGSPSERRQPETWTPRPAATRP